jgi:DNA-binding MurR/RpiR family transcriptional regulator
MKLYFILYWQSEGRTEVEDSSAIYAIRTRYDRLSEKERKIADFVLAHPLESVNPSIETLARKVGVSEATMVRFAKKLGFGGFQRFRIALARETVPSGAQVFETTVPEGEDPVDTVFRIARETLEDTCNHLDRVAAKSAATQMATASRVYLAGLGGSNIIALDAYHKFVRTGIDCSHASDFHLQLMLASQSGPDDVALVISHTGIDTDAIAVAEEFKARGCRLVVLTSDDRSPLARIADIVLSVTVSKNSLVAESFSARTVSMVLIDLLYVEIMDRMQDPGIENLNKMRNAIARRRI